ncbi:MULTISPECIES: hypothetical protein [unclassified Lentimicrobium]|uniref:hypothetical protein n=1 Tax=unclassified Lentimicrobium TaxID=2677434 RepID=UPI0015517460|nr:MULTISPECIES: hypothetical protein [unclassified Lentimicrobium]NPD46581.1 hypothetical protein [Lentimicrobium sp. S6]NPD85724.1 hypothetical protein [Lentimicrobium sp. L6]
MIKYLRNKEINTDKWDACIEDSMNKRIYAYSWYLDHVAPEWGALVMDDYQAVFPVITRKKLGVSYAFQPPFTQQLGIFTPLLLTSDLVQSFIKKLIELHPLVQINLNIHNKISFPADYIHMNTNHELDMIESHEDLKRKYSKNLKRNIKKAQKAELTIFKNLKPEIIIELFKKNKGKQLNAYSEEDYLTLTRLIYKAIKKGRAEIWGSFNPKNQLCAGAIFLKEERRRIFLFSATNKEAKTNGAMPYLIDSYIESYSGSQTILDFEGSNEPNLARFYKSFGSNVIHYPIINYNSLQWYIAIPWKIKKWLNK